MRTVHRALLALALVLVSSSAIAEAQSIPPLRIENSGSVMTRRRYLNFTGAGATVTDDAANNRTTVSISSGGGGTVTADSPLAGDGSSGNHLTCSTCVTLAGSQALTNKTLTSPTISGPTLSGTLGGTFVIGGTPTFSADIAPSSAYGNNLGTTSAPIGTLYVRHIQSKSAAAPQSSSLGTNVSSITISGTDMAGSITITVGGGGVSANVTFGTITFNTNFDATPAGILFFPGNQTAATNYSGVCAPWYVNTLSNSSFTLRNAQAAAAGTYVLYYIVIG